MSGHTPWKDIKHKATLSDPVYRKRLEKNIKRYNGRLWRFWAWWGRRGHDKA